MKTKILTILEGVKDGIDYEKEKKIIDDGLFDSFDIVSLVVALNEEFDIEIDVDELVAENFNSIEGMLDLVKKKEEEF